MTTDRSRRAAALLVSAAAVVGAGVTDRVVSRPPALLPERGPATALASGGSASTSAWYCAAVAGAPAGTQGTVVFTNPTGRVVTGTLDARAAAAAGSQGTGFAVPAAGQLGVPLAAGSAARAVLAGGSVGALQVVSGPLGWSAAPCVSTTSAHWYFAHGSTSPGRSLELALYNPTLADAVVNLTFVSAADGVLSPPAYQGLPVPAGGVVLEHVADHVQNDPSFATEVTALSGTVAAAATELVGGPGNGGLSLLTGVSNPERTWAFAHNVDGPGEVNAFSVLNPSDRATTVTVSIALAQGQAAPVTLKVPAQSLASFAAQDQTRIPPNAPFALRFTSHGPGIVVSRETAVPSGTMPTVGFTAGAPGGQRRWLVPPIAAPGTATTAFGVLNVSGRRTHVTLATLSATGRLVPLPGRARLPLAPGGLVILGPSPGPPIGQAPFVVLADAPVVVELDPEPAGAPGTVVLPAWPLLAPLG